MSRQINQPINQVKLTNVAVVRYNFKGKRFEIACYRNKVMDYRSGLETDLSEVLQTDRIFTNVSKGAFANVSDLEKVFGTRDEEEIAKIILEKGNSLQVSNLERQQIFDNTLSQISTWVASNCVHPETQRPYTVSQIKHALGKNYQVQPHKAIKKQYLDAVKFLKTMIPIERARMELSLTYPAEAHAKVSEVFAQHSLTEIAERSNHQSSQHTSVIQVDPSLYRDFNDLAISVKGRLEILQQVVSCEGDVDLEQEIERKKQRQQTAKEKDDDEGSSSDRSVDELMEKLQAVKMRAAGEDDTDSDEDDHAPRTRKDQRKAKKKNKKQQRREEVKETEDTKEESPQEATPVVATELQPGMKACNTCGGSFSAAEYRAHFRSDWHKFNQKLKLKGLPPVSAEEFRLCDEETFFGMADD